MEAAPKVDRLIAAIRVHAHVEFLPLMDHPFFGSWGCKRPDTSLLPATGAAGFDVPPIDQLHQHKIGVILDWVPSHFPTDEHGLQPIRGNHLFLGMRILARASPDWGTAVFNLVTK